MSNQYSVPAPPGFENTPNNFQNQNNYWNSQQPQQVPQSPAFNNVNQAAPIREEKKSFFSFGKKKEPKEIKFDNPHDLVFDLPPLPPFKQGLNEQKSNEKSFELPKLDEFGTSKNIPEFDVPLPAGLKNKSSFPELPPLPDFKQNLANTANDTFQFQKSNLNNRENKEAKTNAMNTTELQEADFNADFDDAPKPRVYKFEEDSETYVPYNKASRFELRGSDGFKNEQSFNRDKPKRNIISPPSLPETNSKNSIRESVASKKFMNVMEYKKVLDSLEEVNSLNGEVEKITPRLLEIEKEKSIKLKDLQDHLEEAERKLIMIDQKLFER